MSRTTRATPSRHINWIFFDSVNTASEVFCLLVEGYDVEKPLQDHEESLAREIGKRFKFRADPFSIRFWKPQPDLLFSSIKSDWIASVDLTNVAERCQAPMPLLEALGAGGDKAYVHLIVTADELPDSEALAEEQSNTVAELPLHGLHHRYNTLLKRATSFPPSESAKSKEYAKLQRSRNTVIYDGFYAPVGSKDAPAVVTIAPPVQIFHPVFQQFLDKIDDPAFEPDECAIATAASLMSTAAAIRTSENRSAQFLRQHLTQVLRQYMGQIISDNGRSPDGMIFKVLEGCLIPLIVMELKRALGEGGCDPLTQASYSVLNIWNNSELTGIREKCCCPTFIIAGGGPYLAILGVVFTDRFIVQRLTDILWVGEATMYEDCHLYRLARIFASLSLSQRTLHAFYDSIKDRSDLELIPDKPHPRFFPYPTSFREQNSSSRVTFEYLDVLDSDSANVTFLAQTKSSQKLIVKFVDRYGVEAHELLAAAGMAPRLLFCGLLDGDIDIRSGSASAQGTIKGSGLYVGPLRMVIMEYIEGRNTGEAHRDIWPADIYNQIEAALAKLHNAGLVFGDLRPPNIMLAHDPPKVMLIDFDWAGKVGEARYPKNLSTRLKWPTGVKDFLLIEKEHDLVMLHRYFGRRTEPLTIS